jgi:hypothetical protein
MFPTILSDHDNEEDPLDEATELASYWTRDICRTEAGEVMAHILEGLKICYLTGSTPYYLFRPGSHYDGMVLHGKMKLRRLGSQEVGTVSSSDLDAEMVTYGFHSSVLEEIVTACGIQVPIANITTLRYLQELVMVGGGPDGQRRNLIQKKLPKLSFDEKPLGINATSLETIFNLLTQDESTPVPRSLFLHYEDFFVTNRTRLILSAFGVKVPCFSIMVTQIRGRNAAAALSYTSDPPKMFQVKSLPMATALTQWTSMMKGGWIVTETEVKVPGARLFRSQEKVHVWKLLGKFLHETVTKEMSTQEETGEGNQGRKRRPEDDQAQRSVKRHNFTL